MSLQTLTLWSNQIDSAGLKLIAKALKVVCEGPACGCAPLCAP
jgi:hypothetical protein